MIEPTDLKKWSSSLPQVEVKILKPAPSSRGEIRPVTQFPKKFKNQPNFALLGGVIFDINHPKKPMFVVWSWTSKTFIMPFIQLIGTQPPLLLYLLVIRHKNPPESGRWQMSRQEITGKKKHHVGEVHQLPWCVGGNCFSDSSGTPIFVRWNLCKISWLDMVFKIFDFTLFHGWGFMFGKTIGMLHAWKPTWHWKKTFEDVSPLKNGGFSKVMLVFSGGCIWVYELLQILMPSSY